MWLSRLPFIESGPSCESGVEYAGWPAKAVCVCDFVLFGARSGPSHRSASWGKALDDGAAVAPPVWEAAGRVYWLATTRGEACRAVARAMRRLGSRAPMRCRYRAYEAELVLCWGCSGLARAVGKVWLGPRDLPMLIYSSLTLAFASSSNHSHDTTGRDAAIVGRAGTREGVVRFRIPFTHGNSVGGRKSLKHPTLYNAHALEALVS